MNLNEHWEFVKERRPRHWLADAAAIMPNVRLPHCWNSQDSFQESVAYYRGPGSYRRCFQLPTIATPLEWQWFLESEGFYGTGDVWVNGRRAGTIDGQYLGFRLDITNTLNFNGDNVLGIRLTNSCSRNTLPGIHMPDFLLYGGLSGSMRLVCEPLLRLDKRRLAIRCTDLNNGAVRLTLIWAVEGRQEVLNGDRVEWRIKAPDGTDVALLKQTLSARQDCGTVLWHMENPDRWDPESPRLYHAEGRLLRDGQVLHAYALPFGIRTAEFRPSEGFFLNGERVELRGCNRHESMPGLGPALPRWQHLEDARLIKAMGMNFVRLSHYPQHPVFLDACDRLGIMVFAEVASWKSVRGGGWLRRAQRQMAEMIRRDRHHPAVILWGIGNEGRHAHAFRTLYGLCKALDPQRPVTYAENHFYRAERCHTIGIPDIWGLNYEFDALEDGLAASRLKCAIVSECSNYPHTRRGQEDAEQIQLDTIQEDLARIAREPAIAGFALWCFNDYATLRKQRYRRFSGILDAWRLPKASARWLSSTFGDGQLASKLRPDPAAGPASAILLTEEHGSLSAADDFTVSIFVKVIDRQGRLCAWSGDLAAKIRSGPGTVCSFDEHGSVLIADGTGRFLVRRNDDSNATIALEVTGDGLSPGRCEPRNGEQS